MGADNSVKTKKKTGSAGGKRRSSGNRGKTVSVGEVENRGFVREEIWCIAALAFGGFLIVALQTGAAGIIGRALKTVSLGLFGASAYIMPYYMILYSVLRFAKKITRGGLRSTILTVLLFLFIILINAGRFVTAGMDFPGIPALFNGGVSGEGGGLLGMLIDMGLVRLVGRVGLYIFSIAGALISLLILINTSLSHLFRSVSGEIKKHKEKADARAEERQAARGSEEIYSLKLKADRGAEVLYEDEDSFVPIARKGGFSSDNPLGSNPTHDVNIDSEPWFSRQYDSNQGNLAMPEKKPGGIGGFIRNLRIINYMKDDSIFEKKDEGQGKGLDPITPKPEGMGLDAGKDYGVGLEPLPPYIPGLGLEDDHGAEVFNGKGGERGHGGSASGAFGGSGAVRSGAGASGGAGVSRFGAGSFDTSDTGDFGGMHAGGSAAGASGGANASRFGAGAFGGAGADGSAADVYGSTVAGAFGGGGAAGLGGGDFGETGAARSDVGGIGSDNGGFAGTGAEKPYGGESKLWEWERSEDDLLGDNNLKAEQMELDPEALKMLRYQLPPVDLLKRGPSKHTADNSVNLKSMALKLEKTLESFNVEARVIRVAVGPAVTRYEIQPGVGVKVKSIKQLENDIALNLEAKSIRIEAPIPGKAAVGIEVANDRIDLVSLRDIIDSDEFRESQSKITFAVGMDIAGKCITADLKTMPHLLIAGSTGSGKSVCINSIIMSLIFKSKPDEVKLVLIDPKVVELGNYNGIPHLLVPVVTEPGKAASALNWAVAEMKDRYDKFGLEGVRDLASYNKNVRSRGEDELVMPQVVIIIDELADLMMVAPAKVEESICRLAQMARAAGMHLIVATQRPSVDVITGVIKANIPSRIAFAVSSQVDSRTILDMSGAEHLMGSGDMLFNPLGRAKPLRIQGAFVSDSEVLSVIDFVKRQVDADYSEDVLQTIEGGGGDGFEDEDKDELLPDAIETVVAAKQASASMLQRRFRVGYNRAARLIEMMEARGIVGPADGSRPRSVLLSDEEFDRLKSRESGGDGFEDEE